MAQVRRGNTTNTNRNSYNSKNRRNYTQAAYIYESAAPKIDIKRQLEEMPETPIVHEGRRNKAKVQQMNLAYVVFFVMATVVCGLILSYYVHLQSELVTRKAKIVSLESQLNTMRIANDEEWSRIESSIDLEKIKTIAIGELGMTYAQEGQIISYSNEGNDYMRRVKEE